MAYSFGTAGSIPGANISRAGNSAYAPASGIPGTPVAKALNQAQSPTIPTPAAAPTNQTIKKQTVTTAGGDTHVTEYHDPNASSGSPAPTVANNPNSGYMTPNTSGAPQGTPVTSGLLTSSPTKTSSPASNNTYGGLINQVATTAQGNIPIGQSAAQIAADYGQRIADIGQAGARAQGGYLSTGTTPVAEGNSAVIAQSTAAQQQAAAAGEQAALLGTGQQLTAQNQAQSGLLGATTASSPANANVTAPAGEVTTNTLTGEQYSNPIYGAPGMLQAYSPQPGGTTGQPATAGQATQYTVKSGDTLSAIAAANGTTVQALQQANGITDPNMIQAGSTLKIPAAAQGTPFTGGQAQGNQALGQQYAQNVSANNQAKVIKGSIESYLAQNPTLNPSQFSDANAAIQFLNGKVSNPQYQVLSNNLQEYINTLAPILGVGGDTTNLKTQIANGFINAKASGQSISQVLDGIEQLADAKLAAQASGGNPINVPTSTNTKSSSTGSPTSFSESW